MKKFDIIKAKFSPKNIATLKKEAHSYIGITIKWEASWLITEKDGGDYIGQYAMTPVNLKEINFPFGWVPEEDLIEEKVNVE